MCVGSVPVTALSHSTDRPSLSSYCLPRLSNVVESGITPESRVHVDNATAHLSNICKPD
jgi:hypothetical protein